MTPSASTPCVIYARVSTREQGDSGLGLDAQLLACQQEANRRGWIIVGTFREALSGDKAKRPLFDEACALAAKHHGVLLAAKADRISRGTVASVLNLHERADREGWKAYAIDMPEIDTTAPMGEFIITIMAAIARLERRMIGLRTKEALAQAKINGTKSGKPIGRPRSVPDPVLARVASLRGQGVSIAKIADHLNAERLRTSMGPARDGESPVTWNKSKVQKVLNRHV